MQAMQRAARRKIFSKWLPNIIFLGVDIAYPKTQSERESFSDNFMLFPGLMSLQESKFYCESRKATFGQIMLSWAQSEVFLTLIRLDVILISSFSMFGDLVYCVTTKDLALCGTHQIEAVSEFMRGQDTRRNKRLMETYRKIDMFRQ